MTNDFAQINWSEWKATEFATLMFVRDADQILLIRKKRGLGAGKINGPGGRLDPGETLKECAIRETQEELGVTAIDPDLIGRHKFQFVDNYALEVYVYCTSQYSGVAIETEEAIPLWTPINAIPYDEMWEDDRIWIPLMLNSQCFDGRYLFDKDKMLGYRLENLDNTDKLIPAWHGAMVNSRMLED